MLRIDEVQCGEALRKQEQPAQTIQALAAKIPHTLMMRTSPTTSQPEGTGLGPHGAGAHQPAPE